MEEGGFMKKVFVVLMILIFGAILVSCAQKRLVQPQQPVTPQGTKAEVEAKPEQKIPEEKITEQQLAKIETKEVETSKYTEETGMFEDIHFDFDKYDIRPDAKPILQSVSDWLIKNKSSRLLIEGHCDERGTNEYNLALGDRRAKAARDYLVAVGVVSSRLDIISYGEEKPLCTEKTEECWQKNRRAHFVVLKEKGK
jgi:peptidoglycan-associated lipoprotein